MITSCIHTSPRVANDSDFCLAQAAVKRGDIPVLHGIRGCLAVWVLLGHTLACCNAYAPVLSAPGVAVYAFMVMSGFLMALHFRLREQCEPLGKPEDVGIVLHSQVVPHCTYLLPGAHSRVRLPRKESLIEVGRKIVVRWRQERPFVAINTRLNTSRPTAADQQPTLPSS
jgi:hypothetical protein